MHVVVTDTDTIAARSISAILVDVGYTVTYAKSAIDAFRSAIVEGADALLLDTVLPDLDAIRLCHELRTHGFAGIIMFVSHDHERSTTVRALRAGADDYLVKPFDPEELVARLEAIERRTRRHGTREEESVVSVGTATLSLSDLTFRIAGDEPIRLTPTEMRVLELLMRHAGTPVSRDAMIEQLWGVSFASATNLVDVYVARLRRKIEPNSEHLTFLRTVRGYGYVFLPPGEDNVSEPDASLNDDVIVDESRRHVVDSDSSHSAAK
jgi:two-component system, OmpR family, response regulator